METAADPTPPPPSASAVSAGPGVPGTSGTAPALDPPPLRVLFVDGDGRLALHGHPLGSWLTVDSLEATIPALRLPSELAAPAARFRNRRTRFRSATLSFSLAQVGALLTRRDLASSGLLDVAAHIDRIGDLRVRAQARLGDRTAAFTARVALTRSGARRLRLAATDVHLYGYLPVPAPIVAGALLGAVSGAGPAGERPGHGLRATVRWHADVDVLELALLDLFVGHGFRLPDLGGARLESIASSPERIILVFGEGPAATAATPAPSASAARLDEAEGLLVRGEYLTALARLRQGEPGQEPDARTTQRMLEILVAGAATLGEADALATRWLTRDPSALPALLARATVAGERGDGRRAADLYLQTAELADAQGWTDDAVLARAAAAAQRQAAERAGNQQAIPAPMVAAAGSGSGPARALAARCDELVAQGNFDEADRLFAHRIDHAPDETAAALLATERARVRLLGPGAVAALSVLRTLPLRTAPEEALILRADLGERQSSLDDALPALEELAVRARAAGDEPTARQLDDRADTLRARISGRIPTPVDQLEQTLAANPTDPAAAEELAAIYMRIEEPRERVEALAGLLRRALGLSQTRRKEIYASLGQTAEESGDLEQAEQAYWRAATIESEPALRANYIVAHARVLLARGDVQTALAELEEAVSRVPEHAGALALLAELTFRLQDWGRARQLYAALESAPGAADVISREQLMLRRAELAETAGDDVEAETCYREVAILNPRHIDARRVLAEIALRRQDLGGGALRLEEVLRLLPLDALAELLDVRQSLGAVYVQLGDWGSAKYYLELVLAQDPARLTALDLLINVYLRLGLPHEAAAACERLARLYQDPGKRARVLFRKGEILRNDIGDEEAAFDSFLRASDVDPRFAPTLVRLVECFWRQGDYAALAEVAGELQKLGAPAAQEPALALRIAIGCALCGQPPADPSPLMGIACDPVLAADTLVEAAQHLGDQPLDVLDVALGVLISWGNDPLAVELPGLLAERVAADPSAMGPLRALARLSDQLQRPVLARALYAVLVFMEPKDGTADRLAELGPAPLALPAALEATGVTTHPTASGALRRALVILAAALQGFDAPPLPTGTEALRPARAAGLRRLGQLLHTPPFAAAVQPDAPPTARPVTATATRPAMLVVSQDGATLAERAWGFAAGRALEELRSGLCSIAGYNTDEMRGFLQGVAAALAGASLPDDGKAAAAARWLTSSDAVTELPTGDQRAQLANDVQQALDLGPDWETFRRGCAATADRVGLLICGSPLDALTVMSRGDSLITAAGSDDDRRQARAGFVRTTAVRELVRYMLSAEYEQALAPPTP